MHPVALSSGYTIVGQSSAVVLCECILYLVNLVFETQVLFSKTQLPVKPQVVHHVPTSNPMLQLKPHMPHVNNSLKYPKKSEKNTVS